MTRFRWNDGNRELATKHGCSVAEIEQVVRRETRAGRVSKAPIQRGPNMAYRVVGRATGGRMIEVIFLIDDTDELWGDESLCVIHAMPLTTRRRRST